MQRRFSTVAWLALLLLSWVDSAYAEWQFRPAIGVNVAQSTTLGISQAGGSIGRVSWGGNTSLIGNILGVEADFSRRSGFFPAAKQQGAGIVRSSSVTTFTGNVVLTLPSRLVEYTLRPYFVGGIGLMAVRVDYQQVDAFDTSLNMKTTDLGGGVTGFLTKRVGLNWDLRRFSSFGGGPELSLARSTGSPQLSFWRAQMALAIRY
jgi:outer membrane protein with beta-barrel domain